MWTRLNDTLVLGVVLGAFVALLAAFVVWDWGAGPARAALLVAIGALCLAVARWGRSLRLSPGVEWTLLAAGVAAALAHLVIGGAALVRIHGGAPFTMDQGAISHRAVRALVDDHINPYAANSLTDTTELAAVPGRLKRAGCLPPGEPRSPGVLPSVVDTEACHRLRAKLAEGLGYKYGPAQLVVYAPFVVWLGPAGLFATHIALYLLFVAALVLLSLRWFGRRPLPVAIVLLLAHVPGHLAWNTLHLSSTDLLPLTCNVLMLTFLAAGRPRLGAAGAGLSISAKLLPGLLYLPLVSRAPLRHGWPLVAVAALFWMPFALWDPDGLVANVLLFNAERATDSTALAHFVPPGVGLAVRVLVAGVIGALALWGHRRRWDRDAVLGYLVAAHLGVCLAGPIFHNNYLVWLVPLLGLFVAHHLAPAPDSTG